MINIGSLKITASRWPGQAGYDWRGMTNCTAPMNNGSRFGGGWKYKLGVSTGGWNENGWGLHFDLLFGNININWRTAIGRKADDDWKEIRIKMRVDEAVKKAVVANDEGHAKRREAILNDHSVATIKRDAEVKTLKLALGNLVSAVQHRQHEIPAVVLTFLKVSLDDANKALKIDDDEIPF